MNVHQSDLRTPLVGQEGSSARLKVCHVFAGTEGGRWVYEQADMQREYGCDTTVVLSGLTGSTVDLCRDAGIPIKAMSFRVYGWRNLFSLPVRVIQFALWLRREKFDVVQSHIIPSTLFARPAAYLADVPVRLEMSTSPFYMQAPSIRWVEVATAWMETGLIPSCAITSALYHEAGIAPARIQEVLYYGPHEDRFQPDLTQPERLREEFGLAPDTPLVGSIAVFYDRCADSSFVPPEIRNEYIKGHTYLMLAMRHVRAKVPNACLIMVGQGWGPNAHVIEAELKDFVRANQLDDFVFFAGWRKSTPAVLVDLDVSVQASLNENLGGTVESLLMARPTVATRVGGMPDAVIDGKTGILVEPKSPEDLARGIVDLLQDPVRAAAFGRAGRTHMLERFTITTTVPALVRLYRRQRVAAPGAWRWPVFAARLVVLAAVTLYVATRLLLVDIYLGVFVHAYLKLAKRRLAAAWAKL